MMADIMFNLRDLPSHSTLLQFARSYPDLDVSALESWLLLLRSASDEVAEFENFLSEYGLSPTKFFVLILLKRNPDGLAPSRLAEGVDVSYPTMTGIVDRLERDGVVRREETPEDRRCVPVRLTKKGQALLDSLLPPHYARVAQLFGGLTKTDRATLKKLLGKLRQSAKEKNDE